MVHMLYVEVDIRPASKKARRRKARYVAFTRIPGSVWRPIRLFSKFITLCHRRNELRIAVTESVAFAVSK